PEPGKEAPIFYFRKRGRRPLPTNFDQVKGSTKFATASTFLHRAVSVSVFTKSLFSDNSNPCPWEKCRTNFFGSAKTRRIGKCATAGCSEVKPSRYWSSEAYQKLEGSSRNHG